MALYGLVSLAGVLVTRANRMPAWPAAALPLAGLVFSFTMLRSGFLAERRGAILWRGTAYSLKRLRRAHREFVGPELARLRSRSGRRCY